MGIGFFVNIYTPTKSFLPDPMGTALGAPASSSESFASGLRIWMASLARMRLNPSSVTSTESKVMAASSKVPLPANRKMSSPTSALSSPTSEVLRVGHLTGVPLPGITTVTDWPAQTTAPAVTGTTVVLGAVTVTA